VGDDDLVVAVFASGYLLLARSADGQLVGVHTKTDALYFTISTLATVGFGDVHPSGQLARSLVTIQIVFDLVFVAALVAALTGGVRRGIAARRDEGAR
jgi:voltage-gated potassium channel